MTGHRIHTSRGYIEYSSVGTGRPILFIHGGHSNCNETLCHKGLDSGKYQFITPSRPGYGKTPLDGNRTPGQAARLIAELIDSLSLEDVIVYGISAGGPTAIELAGNYPDKVGKLILASAVSKKWLDENGKTHKTARVIFHPAIEKATWGMVRLFSKIAPQMIARSFFPQFSKKPLHTLKDQDVKDLMSAMKHYHSGRGFLNDIGQTIHDSALLKIKCPTLIIHSRNDSSVPIGHALHADSLIENSKLLELDNEWGHLIWIGSDSITPTEQLTGFIEE